MIKETKDSTVESKRQIPHDAVRVDKAMCKKCKYGKTFVSGNTWYCDYLLMKKQRKGCPYGWCNKFEPKKQKRVKK